ncbi:B12-binding domain-containing radical SAM protein [Amphritea sp.]|uniref:B12-binding domain-containing radical SAM protein n=1 Tax=Amphritea sp. TaxID=1872502 RepID=UPI003D0C1AFC
MKKHIVLVSLDWERPQDGRSSLGIASIAASLKAAEIPYQVIEDAVNSPDFDYLSLERRVLETINELESLGHECLVGIGAFIWNEQQTQQLTKSVRTVTNATQVLGGPQISYMEVGQLELNYPYADIFVRGHGEKAMVSLATESIHSSAGIHFSGTKDLGEKAEHSLNDLPSPWLTGILIPGKNIRWETMRGCPFRCSFCQHRESGNRFKTKEQQLDIIRIQNEVNLFAKSGVKRISILDPIFHLDTPRTVELLNQFRDVGLTAQLALQCRFESVKDEFLDALEGLEVVLEFGLQTAIQEEGKLIGRPNRLDIAEKVIHKLKARNIPFEISLIYGLPEQTVESFGRSLAWCRSQGVPEIRAWPLMILRGTELDKQRECFGLVESTDETIPHVIASNSFNHAEYLQMKALADASNIRCIINEPEGSNYGIFYRA